MSAVKNPREKKRLRLKRERRNRYGENNKASRKNIPRSKQRQHMNERRTAGEVVARLKGQVQEDQATDAEFLIQSRVTDLRRHGFKKYPDVPLRVVLENRKTKRPSK